MKLLKKVKLIITLLFMLAFVPLLFSCHADASELDSDDQIFSFEPPVATVPQADVHIDAGDIPIGSAWDFNFPYAGNDSKFGKITDLLFNLPFEFQYISSYIDNQALMQEALKNGSLSLTDYNLFVQNYELAWLHILINMILVCLFFGFTFKIIRRHLDR